MPSDGFASEADPRSLEFSAVFNAGRALCSDHFEADCFASA